MPFVKLSADQDDFNVFWRSNLPDNDVSSLAANGRETLLLLPPAMMSVDFLNEQFDDPALQVFNMIAFDPPGYGKTHCPRLKTREQLLALDDWVMAALIGDFCLTLGLPEVHVFAPMGWSAYVAPRFAILFPKLCKSIVSCGVSFGFTRNAQEYVDITRSLMDTWIHATTPEEMEPCVQNFWYLLFGEVSRAKLDPEEQERIIDHWMTHWCLANAGNIILVGPMTIMRVPLTPEQSKRVVSPMTIIQGTTNHWTPPEMAYEMASSFRGVPFGGPRVEIIHGAPYGMAVLSHFAPKVNRIIATHVEQVALASSPTRRPISSRSKAMRAALDILSDVSGPKWRHKVAERNTGSVLSFSLRPPEVIDRAYERWLNPCLTVEEKARRL